MDVEFNNFSEPDRNGLLGEFPNYYLSNNSFEGAMSKAFVSMRHYECFLTVVECPVIAARREAA
jgi:hypothetical protein